MSSDFTGRSLLGLSLVALGACSDFRGRPADASADGADASSDASVEIDCGASIPTVVGTTRTLQASDLQGTLWGLHMKTATRDAMGRILLAGGMGECGPSRGFGAGILRLTSDGRIDRSFGTEGRQCVVPNIAGWIGASVFGLALDAQQRVVAVGVVSNSSPAPNAPDRAFVLRLTATGAIDTSFGTNGWVDYRPGRTATEVGYSTAFYSVMADGDRIVAAGGDELPTAPSGLGIVVRFSEDGSVDDSFNQGRPWVDDGVAGLFSIAKAGADYVVAGSSFQATTVRVSRIDRSGTAVDSFGTHGTATHDAGADVHVRSVGVDRAGRIYAAGGRSSEWNDSAAPPTVVRFLPDGRSDLSYGTRGEVVVNNAAWTFTYVFERAMHVQCDGSLFIGSHIGNDPAISAVDATGRAVTSFGRDGTVALSRVVPYVGLVVGIWPLADGAGIGAACTYATNQNQSVLEIRR